VKVLVRGIRGAITVTENTATAIKEATKEMLQKIMAENQIAIKDIASAIFSVTEDLNAAFPAAAAREIGWDKVPLFCTKEIPVPGSLKLCIRVLLHVNTEKHQDDIKHIYLRKAASLRMDLTAQ
jgi:chorismate mutase